MAFDRKIGRLVTVRPPLRGAGTSVVAPAGRRHIYGAVITAVGVAAPIALVASTSATPGVDGGMTGAINTTGATLLVASVAAFAGGGAPIPSVGDTKGNTWIALTTQTEADKARLRLFYCLAPVVGSGHAFYGGGDGTYPAVFVYAFSGVVSYQTESGTVMSGGSGASSGSVTPSSNGALILTGLSGGVLAAGTDTVSPVGFTLTTAPYSPGVNIQGAAAYFVQPTAAAINPTWAWTEGAEHALTTAVFLPGAGTVDCRVRHAGGGGLIFNSLPKWSRSAPATTGWVRE